MFIFVGFNIVLNISSVITKLNISIGSISLIVFFAPNFEKKEVLKKAKQIT